MSLFEVFFLLVVICWILGALGVYWLVRELKGEKITATLSAFFYFFGPIVPFLFRFSDGLYLIAFSFLPYILILYAKFLQHRGHREEQKRRIEILLCLLIAFVVLLDASIIPIMILGMVALVALFLAQVRWKKAEEKLKSSLVLLFLLAFYLWLFDINEIYC